MRSSVLAVTLAVLFAAWSCAGGSGSSSPSAPSTPGGSSPAPGPTTITVTSINGAQSFSPNPASIPQGEMVVWRNADTIAHRVLLNDGSIDTGNIAAGASSAPMRLNTNGANYHCSLHPSMVGSINASTGTAPPCEGAYC